jgi:2-hydroxy-3-keto-5-methylthiopentenyl-1-phosphate phosphatase
MVFFDFDNTITPYDVLDRMIHDFSVDRKWVEYEEAWKKGRIGSRLCLEGQLCSLRVSRKELSRYLSRVRIEPAFRRLSGLLRKERVPLVVLSDNFLSSIRHILSNNGIKGIRIYANRLAFTGERLKPSFPYVNKRCKLCAHCK